MKVCPLSEHFLFVFCPLWTPDKGQEVKVITMKEEEKNDSVLVLLCRSSYGQLSVF